MTSNGNAWGEVVSFPVCPDCGARWVRPNGQGQTFHFPKGWHEVPETIDISKGDRIEGCEARTEV